MAFILFYGRFNFFLIGFFYSRSDLARFDSGSRRFGRHLGNRRGCRITFSIFSSFQPKEHSVSSFSSSMDYGLFRHYKCFYRRRNCTLGAFGRFYFRYFCGLFFKTYGKKTTSFRFYPQLNLHHFGFDFGVFLFKPLIFLFGTDLEICRIASSANSSFVSLSFSTYF